MLVSSSPTSGYKKKTSQLLRFLAFILRRFTSSSSKAKAKYISGKGGFPSPAHPLAGSVGTMMVEAKAKGNAAGMQRAVKQLHFGGWDEKAAAATEIKRLAKEDPRARRLLAELGVIPSLMSMLVESQEDHRCRPAIEALLDLASGSFTNKVLVVKAGLLSRLPQLMCTKDSSIMPELASLLLSISSLAKANIPIATHHIIPILVKILDAPEVADEVKLTCLETVYNLSTKLENMKAIVASGAVHSLLRLSLDKRASAGALATLGNLVLSAMGKKAVGDDSMVPGVLIEIMAWDDKPRCQELVAYVLMVLAHGNVTQRKKMAELGIVPLLLEVALLGSPLAQKRAIKMLQWFKDERRMKKAAHSGPQAERILLSSISAVNGKETKECRKAIKKMVKQSLDRNIESIVRRANASEDSSRLKAFVVSSSSKSLPY